MTYFKLTRTVPRSFTLFSLLVALSFSIHAQTPELAPDQPVSKQLKGGETQEHRVRALAEWFYAPRVRQPRRTNSNSTKHKRTGRPGKSNIGKAQTNAVKRRPAATGCNKYTPGV